MYFIAHSAKIRVKRNKSKKLFKKGLPYSKNTIINDNDVDVESMV